MAQASYASSLGEAGVDAVVFDLGGVLIRVDGVAQLSRWLGEGTTVEAAWERWLSSPSVRRFETGGCTVEEFAAEACRELALPVPPEQFVEDFGRWPGALEPGALELLQALRAQQPGVRLACLSNSNPVHWAQMRHMGLVELLDECFLSHELGVLKPDPEVFERVVAALGCEPGRVLFLDDNEVNVAGARRAGLVAERVLGATGAAEALRARGLVAPSP